MTARARLVRLATRAVACYPPLWPVLRPWLRATFDELAPVWDERRVASRLAGIEAGLEAVPSPPRRALDVGTGTGDAAIAIARRWPDAEVHAVDVAPAMLHEARRKLPTDVAGRVQFELADAAALPYPDAAFELVVLANMIPFFDELARVCADGGHVVFCFSLGPRTPIYVPPARIRRALDGRGFVSFRELRADPATALLARKGESQ